MQGLPCQGRPVVPGCFCSAAFSIRPHHILLPWHAGSESDVSDPSACSSAFSIAQHHILLAWHAGSEFDADTAIVPTDSLSRQALEAQAKDMAIEDALYALDKALQHGTITSEAYLKQVSDGAPPMRMGCINAIE